MFVIFFFQAEDGIRDYKVTGVQTCALPISPARSVRPVRTLSGARRDGGARPARGVAGGQRFVRRTRRGNAGARSEERRVGEEGRSRGAPDHLKKKKKDKVDDGVVRAIRWIA